MNFVKVANNVFSGVKLATNVGTTVNKISKIGQEPKPEVLMISEKVVSTFIPVEHRFFRRRLLTDISVLQTILEKISKSENEELINDIEKHQIPERFEELSIMVMNYKKRGFQSLSNEDLKELRYVLDELECIYEQTKTLMLAATLSSFSETRF
uniref:Uncharacterized protein n=1 Tax=Caenorhabditis tropicalis TaxID=1561998 RepID=A0A1I7TY46_9PELO